MAGMSKRPIIVTARPPRRQRLPKAPKAAKKLDIPNVVYSPRRKMGPPPTPEELQERGDAADRLWKDLVRGLTGK
jgi:hypothetical protein